MSTAEIESGSTSLVGGCDRLGELLDGLFSVLTGLHGKLGDAFRSYYTMKLGKETLIIPWFLYNYKTMIEPLIY